MEKLYENEVSQSCPTLCNPVDCSLPASSLHGILQTRILEWVAISFARGSSRPSDQTQDSCIVGRHFNLWATREAWSQLKQDQELIVAQIMNCLLPNSDLNWTK